MITRWLTGREAPSVLDRVLIDNTVLQLPPEARRTIASNHPQTVDELVRQLENWQVAQQLSYNERKPTRHAEPRRDRRGSSVSQRTTLPRPSTPSQEPREDRRCFSCGQVGHLARQCPGSRDVSMPSAFAAGGQTGPCLQSTCRAWVPLSTPSESSAEEDGSDGDDPILPSTPAHSTGGTLGQDLGNQTTTLRRRRQLRNRQARQEKQRAHPSPSSRISTRQGDGERIGPGSSQMLNFRTTP